MPRIIHPLAGMIALLTIATFWLSTVISELFLSEAAVVAVKTTIPWGFLLLVPALAAVGGSGFFLSHGQRQGLVFRGVIGGLLMVEGWPKIIAPLAQTGFVESIGLHPGWFFSPLVAVTQFIGGFLIVIGLLTRPVALANALMLAVTIWFHVTRPYGDAFLTAEGIEYLQSNLQYLTDQGQARLLADGGARFLHQVQAKAEFNSIFWTAGAAIIAAFGGGRLSVDRWIGREF